MRINFCGSEIYGGEGWGWRQHHHVTFFELFSIYVMSICNATQIIFTTASEYKEVCKGAVVQMFLLCHSVQGAQLLTAAKGLSNLKVTLLRHVFSVTVCMMKTLNAYFTERRWSQDPDAQTVCDHWCRPWVHQGTHPFLGDDDMRSVLLIQEGKIHWSQQDLDLIWVLTQVFL